MSGIAISEQSAKEEEIFPDADDAALVARCQAGEHDAFEPLVTRYRGKIYAMIMNMTGNDPDAWDLTQEVFIKAWRALPRFESRSSFYTWIYRITHNVTYDWMRKKKIKPGMEFDDTTSPADIAAGAVTVPHADASPDEVAQSHELGQTIQAALKMLSPEHRSVILLKEIDGLSYQEIADSLSLTIGTVMSRLFYARKKLQILLQDIAPHRD